jgi:hypothetical protein
VNDYKARYEAAVRAKLAERTAPPAPKPPPSGEQRKEAVLALQGDLKAAWIDTATWALEAEAAKRGRFTAEVLHEMVDRNVLPDPGERRVFGAVIDRLKKQGKIFAVGTAKAERGERQGGYLTVWEWRSR